MQPDLNPKNFLMTLEYDGSAYHGWQRQKHEPTIQAQIESVIQTMTSQPVTLIGSGRTDAGVHALGQAASFRCATALTPAILHKGLNSLLPSDIVITSMTEVPYDFHARYDVIRKTYRYQIRNRALPAAVGRQFEWFVRKPLDLENIREAVRCITGTHDFKAFEATGSPRSHTVRTVFHADLQTLENGLLAFTIQADGFLRYMVRNLVGTLVEIGHGKIRPGEMANILLSRNRKNAGATAPPHGLFLVSVDYPELSAPA